MKENRDGARVKTDFIQPSSIEPQKTKKCKAGKSEKPEFTHVNEDFEDAPNAAFKSFLGFLQEADVGLIFTAYNLMRLINLLGVGFAGLFKAVFGGILRRYKGIWGHLAVFWRGTENNRIFFDEGIDGMGIGLILGDGRGYGTN